ncbi:MAG: serine hydrolase domain-containing protein [Acidobacteriota bacterium]
MSESDTLALPHTRELLEHGIEQELHFGAQVYVSLGAGASGGSGEGMRRVELMVGDHTLATRDAPRRPMTPDTLMIWLSSTKPITAVAIGQLWERGLLDLDDPVARHVPEFAARGKERITLRHVLTHTGGIRMLSAGWPEASWEEILDTICQARPEPRWPLGEKAGYHLSSSWFLLGEVLRRVDGRHFRDYVRQEIFEPLGMVDSWVGMPRDRFLAYDGRLGTMYGTEGSIPRARRWNNEPQVVGCSPGGNGYGPIRELGRFYEMLLARGQWQGARILTPQTLEALTTPHRVGLYDHTFKHKLDWGLGFIVNSNHYGAELPPYGYGRHASRRTFGHSGFQSSTGFADPEHDLAVALVTNGNPGEPRHTERFRDLTEAIYEDLGLAPEN